MRPEHRDRLITILAALGQCRAEAERIIADPVHPDIAVRAGELREMHVEMQARVEQHLDGRHAD